MRKLALFALLVGGLVVGALPAMAHDATVEGDCDGWVVHLDGKWGAVKITIATPAGIPNVTIEGEALDAYPDQGGFDVEIADTRFRQAGSFTVTWHKANPANNHVEQLDGVRDQSDCLDIEVVNACGLIEGMVTKNETAFGYAVAFELAPASYNLGNAQFGSMAFAEDENGGMVTVAYYVVGAESDFVVGFGLPNFWEQSAAEVEVDTDCEAPVTTTTMATTTTTMATTTTTQATTTTTESTTTSDTVIDTVVTTTPDDDDELPFTGIDSGLGLGIALALLAVGGLTLRASRRMEG